MGTSLLLLYQLQQENFYQSAENTSLKQQIQQENVSDSGLLSAA